MANDKIIEVEEMDDNDFAMLEALQKLVSIMSKKDNKDIVTAINSLQFKMPEMKLPQINIPEVKLPTINVPTPQVTVNANSEELKNIMQQFLDKKMNNYEMEVTQRDTLGRIIKVKIKTIN